MKLKEINAESIQKEDDDAVLNIHRHLHGLWAQHFEGNDKTTTDGLTREDLVNVHIVVERDMERRGMQHAGEPADGLDRAAEEIAKKSLPDALAERHPDAMLVPKFVAVTGSVGEGREGPGDLDVLIRADRVEREGGPGFFVRAEDVELPVRKRLDPEKTGLPIHWNANPQGPHDDHLALADLVLRWRVPPEREEAKAINEAYQEFASALGRDDLTGEEKHSAFLAAAKAGRRIREIRLQQLREIYEAWRKLGEEIADVVSWGDYEDAEPEDIVIVYGKAMGEGSVSGGGALVPTERGLDDPLRLTFLGTGAMNAKKRKGAALLVEYKGKRVQIDGEKPGDIQENLDALLVTDPQAWNAEAAKKAGGEVGKFEENGLSVKPRKVRHTSHDVYGYEIAAGGKRIAYTPELWAWPAWAKEADLAVVDGSAWDEDIEFAQETGGHRALTKLAASAKKAGVKRIVATHIGNPTLEAMEKGHKIEGVEVAADGKRVEVKASWLKAVSPGSRYAVMKPSVAGVTEFFDTSELWESWAKAKLDAGRKLLGSPKIDGFRAVISWDGEKPNVWFEDAQETKIPSGFPDLSGPSFVVEGEYTARRGGKWLARTQLAGALKGDPESDPHFWLYDLLYYDGEDVSKRPFSERLAHLKKLRLPTNFTVLAQRPVGGKDGLGAIGKWAAGRPLSEGLFIRQADAPYAFGSTDTAAKLKTVFEIKVRVLEAIKKTNGWVFHCALRGGGFQNAVEEGGQPYVDLGNTFVSKTKMADAGDTLNVRIEELILLSGDRLAWGKPTPVGPDKSRPAYTVGQAVGLARRGGVLKEEVEIKALREEETRGEAAEGQWADNWQKLVAKGEGRFILHGHFPALAEEQKDWPLDRLLKEGLSYHTDDRHEAPSPFGAWGFTCFEGKSEEVGPKGTRLHDMPPDKPMRGVFKLEQPREWLSVGKQGPHISEWVGKIGKDYAKFFALDWGKYKLTFAREHAFEVIYDGEKGVLKGRYQINYVPIGGRRAWMISRPAEQGKIYADDHDFEKIKAELRKKGQKWLFWRESLDAPLRKIDVAKGEEAKTMNDFDFEDELTDSELLEIGRAIKAGFDFNKVLTQAVEAIGKKRAKGAISALQKLLDNIEEYGYVYGYGKDEEGYGYPTPKAAKDTGKIKKLIKRAIEALDQDEPDYDEASDLVGQIGKLAGYAEPGKAGTDPDKLKNQLMSAVGELNKDEPDWGKVADLLKKVLDKLPGYEKPKGKSLAIKILQEDDEKALVGGHLLLWGNPEQKDLADDYFTPQTLLWLDEYKSVPALFHHGLDDHVGLAVIGHRVKAVPDDIGVWVEHWLKKSSRYWALVRPLLEAEALYYSPGSAPHLVEREKDGKLKSFPVVEDTMTPIPCQHRLLPVAHIKAVYESANIALPKELERPTVEQIEELEHEIQQMLEVN